MIVINLREGKTGRAECTAAIAIALVISGLFSFESSEAYANGNSTYLSLPIACFLAFAVFALCAFAMKKSKSGDLTILLNTTLGKIPATVLSIYFSAIIIACTCTLLNRFLNILRSFFFQDASYYAIAVYMLLVISVLAATGFEAINRTAKLTSVFLIIVMLLLFVNSGNSYQLYKIYPIAGDGATSMSLFSLQSTVYFLPALIVALIASRGMHGVRNASKNAATAVVISAALCAVSQLFLALSYTYDELAKLYMPLYRMSMVTGTQNFLVRLDKISVFIWMSGVLIACGYYIYGASLLHCKAFSQSDIRPAACSFSLVTVIICLITHLSQPLMFRILNFIHSYGTWLIGVPLILISVIAIIKYYVKEQKNARA